MLAPPQVLALGRNDFAAQIVRQLEPSLRPRVVYDIGAGNGSMRVPVEAVGLEWRGFDLAPGNELISSWSLDDSCPAGVQGAGMVLLLEVIEHLRNPGAGLRHVAEVLPAGGRLLISTPNPRWSRSRLHAVRTGFLACFTQADLDENSHVFPVWPHILERMLKESGFFVEHYYTLDGATSWPRGTVNLRYPLRVLHAALNKWIERRDPSACGMAYAFLARRET